MWIVIRRRRHAVAARDLPAAKQRTALEARGESLRDNEKRSDLGRAATWGSSGFNDGR
jgi:hypothetical protein